jgi:Tfp pilus assembly protein PilZ
VHLVVRYPGAAEFVADYVENLSEGGLFVAGAHELPLGHVADVEIMLPGEQTWTVRARVMFILPPDKAQEAGRNAGAGMELVEKPPGFDDALLGYLVRLGRRRERLVMVSEGVLGGKAIERSGYRVTPLVDPASIAKLAEETPDLIALVVPAVELEMYRSILINTPQIAECIFGVAKAGDIPDIIATLDGLL